jgi:hypothetical protein
MREAQFHRTQTTMKPHPHRTAVPRHATAGSPKRLSTSTTPRRPHTQPGKLGAQPRGPVQWMLLLILLCPVAAAVGAGIPDPGDPGPTNIVLNSWSFTDTTNWFSDLGYPPVSLTNLNVSDLGAGTALVVDSPDPAWLQYNVIENGGTTNLAVDQGSVMFWFAPNWAGTNEGGTGPGEWGRLIEVGSYTEDASYGWWSLYTDPDGVNIYFSAQGNDGSQTNYLSAPIAWITNRWHLIALTYSTAANCLLYIDGELATNGPPIIYMPGPEVLANGFYIGSASNGTAQAHGMFDALATYANPLDAGTIQNTYWYGSAPYYFNPMNVANLSPAPSTPQLTPTFVAITGPGYLQNLGIVSNCVSSSAVWMTNVVATLVTNGTVNVAFTILGGSNSLPYDVFATAGLVGRSITNAQWGWMGQGYQCARYLLTNLPSSSALLILGTPQDTDQDGLTDAYELLVSHSRPDKADSSGDGMLDGWKVLWGLTPSVTNTLQAGQRANYSYDPAGWLNGVTGRRGETIGSDPEGNVLNDRP